MANLLSWLGNAAKGVERQLNPFDNGATYKNPTPAPRPIAAPAPVAARPAIQPLAPQFVAPRPIIPPPSLQTAQNPITATAKFGLNLAQNAVTRPIAETALTLTHPFTQHTSGAPTSTIDKILYGNKPIQNINKKVASTYTAHGGGAKGGSLAAGEALVSLLQDAPILGTAARGAGVAARELPAAASTVSNTASAINSARTPLKANEVGSVSAGANGVKVPSKIVAKRTTTAPPIVPTKKISATKAAFESKVNVLHEIGNNAPSAHTLADHITATDNLSQTLAANAKNRMPTVFALGKEDFANLGNVIEHGAKPANAQVAQAAKEAKATLPDIHTAATKAGLDVGKVKNYFPRDYSNLKTGTPDYNAAIQHLINTKQAKSPGEAVQLLNSVAKGKGTSPSFFGNFDRSRLDVPGYGYSKDSLQAYINGAATKTAQATHFGPKGETANDLIGKIAQEGGDAKLAKRAVDNYLQTPGGRDVLAPVRGAYSAVRLVKAPISHLGQSTNVPLVTRLSDYGAGLAGRFSEAGKKIVSESDVNNPANIHGLSTQETGINGITGKVTAAGLGPVQKFNRGVAAIAGSRYGDHLAATGDEAGLRDLGVTGKIDKTLTDVQRQQAARGVANKTMFNPSRAQTPIGAETPVGKTIGQYRTAYSYKQTGLVYNQVVKEAAAGNFKPLAKFLALSVPAAAGTTELKSAITPGSTNTKKQVAATTAANLGGIPGELAGSIPYVKGNPDKTIAGDVAPLAGESIDLLQRGGKALNGNPKSLESYGAGLVPIVGKKIGQTINPPPAVVPKGSAADLRKKATDELNTIKNSPSSASGYSLDPLSNGHYAVTMNGQVTEEDTLKSARQKIAKDAFGKTGSGYKVIGDSVLRKAQDGTVTVEPKIKFDYQVGAATLISQKNADDLTGYIKTANSQLDSIQTQLKDPNIDPLDALTLQNDASTLQANIDKYTSYGGFTKPKAASTSAGSSARSSFSTASKAVAKPAGVSVRKLSAPSFKATKPQKISVSRIPSNYLKKKLT